MLPETEEDEFQPQDDDVDLEVEDEATFDDTGTEQRRKKLFDEEGQAEDELRQTHQTLLDKQRANRARKEALADEDMAEGERLAEEKRLKEELQEYAREFLKANKDADRKVPVAPAPDIKSEFSIFPETKFRREQPQVQQVMLQRPASGEGEVLTLLASWSGSGSDSGTVTVTGVPNARIESATFNGSGDGDTGDERMKVTIVADTNDISFGGLTAIDFDPAGVSLTADAAQFVTSGEIDFELDPSHGANGTFFVDVFGYLVDATPAGTTMIAEIDE